MVLSKKPYRNATKELRLFIPSASRRSAAKSWGWSARSTSLRIGSEDATA